MSQFDAGAYGPVIARILALDGDGRRPMPLAPRGCRSEVARGELEHTDAAALFAPRSVVAADFAEAARAGLFLYFSCLEECHSIAQQIAGATGSYWHGIMHRQEPDFGNAAYWFRRVKQHEIFAGVREAAAAILPGETWDSFRFIEACEQVRRKPDAAIESALEQIQLVEWQLLFDYCCRRAVEAQS